MAFRNFLNQFARKNVFGKLSNNVLHGNSYESFKESFKDMYGTFYVGCNIVFPVAGGLYFAGSYVKKEINEYKESYRYKQQQGKLDFESIILTGLFGTLAFVGGGICGSLYALTLPISVPISLITAANIYTPKQKIE